TPSTPPPRLAKLLATDHIALMICTVQSGLVPARPRTNDGQTILERVDGLRQEARRQGWQAAVYGCLCRSSRPGPLGRHVRHQEGGQRQVAGGPAFGAGGYGLG